MKTLRVLITSAGAGPAIAVIKALKRQGTLPVHVIAADMDATAAGLYLADERVLIPPVSDPAFEATLFRVVRERRVDFLIPIFDVETPFFSARREQFLAEANVRVLVSKPETIRVANDKLASHDRCVAEGIRVPRLYTIEEALAGRATFPLLIKPRYGIGSKGVRRIASRQELEAVLPLGPEDLVFEFLEGREYTVDSFSDLEGRCLAAVPRERLVVKAGQSVKGRTIRDERLMKAGRHAAEAFGIEGPACSQWILRDGVPYFVEMNPRYGTGVSLTIAAGVHMPVLHLKLGLGLPIPPEELQFKDGWFMSRYWEEVFFEDPSKFTGENVI